MSDGAPFQGKVHREDSSRRALLPGINAVPSTAHGSYSTAHVCEGGAIMGVDVKCSVSNCLFWKENNNCGAPAIMVTVDRQANANFHEEIANEIMVDLQSTHLAPDSLNTCCHTFRPN